MNFAPWVPGAVSAAVAVIGGVVSVIMWLRAKDEREEAARQAKIATDSAETAANALNDIAELHRQRDQRQQARDATAEHDPWLIHTLPDTSIEAELYNDSDTPKWCVNVRIEIEGDVAGSFADKTFQLVGPRRRVRIPYIRVGAPVQATIMWHLVEDCSDEPLTQTIDW
jgi:hypothetical protein